MRLFLWCTICVAGGAFVGQLYLAGVWWAFWVGTLWLAALAFYGAKWSLSWAGRTWRGQR